MRTIAAPIFLAVCLLSGGLSAFTVQVRAQGGVPIWTNRYSGPLANGHDGATAVAVDSSGNVFVAGNSTSTNGDSDYATVAYSGAGVPLWTNRYNGPGNFDDSVRAIVVGSNGNVFVTGYSHGGGSLNDYATIAYSNTGVPLWTNRYGGPGNFDDFAQGVAVDSNGNVFVTGYSYSGSSSDYATVAYSGAGVPIWTNLYHGPTNSVGSAIALVLDSSGNVFVTGSSLGSGSDYDSDYATIKYSGAGVPLWTNRYNGPTSDNDHPTALAVDSSGNVFVTGYVFGRSALEGGSVYDYATVAYSSAGLPLWTNLYNGPANNDDQASAIAVDRSGHVFVTGYSLRQSSSPYFWDYTTVAYSSGGVALWTNRYNEHVNSRPTAAAADSSGNVFVTGYWYDSSSGNSGWATVAYSAAGAALWTNRYSGPLANGIAVAAAVAVDSSGNVFVTGGSEGLGSGSDYLTIKYSSSLPPIVRLNVQRVNNQIVLNWTNAAFGLQTALTLTDTFTNLPGATSPYTNPIAGPQQFFRLKAN